MSDERASAVVTVKARLAFPDGSEDALGFFQRRVANAGLFGVCFAGGFALLRTLITAAKGDFAQLASGDFTFHAAAVVPLLALWLYCRRGTRSERQIVAAEMTCMSLAGGFVIAMGASMPVIMRPDYVVALALGTVLAARAIYVPSTARRTLALHALATPPYLVMVYHGIGRWPQPLVDEALRSFQQSSISAFTGINVVLSAAWWAGLSAVCVAASRVIYGLRQEVRKVQRLGQYQLEEKLGEGGMGIVYRAHHALLQRPTAVKLLPPDQLGERALERFEREVRQTARLSHPNTITIYDYGHTPDGLFYYAMELVDGVSLARVIEATGPMPAARVLHVLRQAAGSLAEAHSIGLVHRDIKPDNIMLCEQGGVPDTVKVLDFGLVKEVARNEDLHLTGSNVILGTPQYMPPEAIAAPEKIDARADLYSLGATAYYLLTGRDVFEAETVVELCSHHLRTEPTPPSRWVENVPPDLEMILLACLAKKPADRPVDARALLLDLERCCDAGEWSAADASGWWARHGHELARPAGISTTAPTVLAPSLERAPA